MSFKTRTEITTSVYNELALVAGSSVQTYTQPIVEETIQTTFEHFFKKRFWDHLTLTTFHTLDGAGGVITDTLSGIEDVTDIEWIRETPYRPENDIRYFRDGLFDSQLLGYRALQYTETGYENKRIIFNPVTSTADIAIRARRMPEEFQDDDQIPLDWILLKHTVTATLLAADGMSPGQQSRQEGLAEDRYDTLISNEANKPIVTESMRFRKEFTVET